MGRRIVTITESLGSGGSTIGRAVGERLGIQIIDREVLQRAAQLAGVSLETVEEAEQTQPFLARMLEMLGRYPVIDDVGAPMVEELPTLSVLTNDNYRRLIEEVTRSIANTGEAVIIGHASHIILKDYPNVVRVYLNAPLATRVSRVGAAERVDPATAEKVVRDSDTQRRSFFEDHYKVKRNEAQNYDLCLRTDKLSFDTCVEIICLATAQVAR